MCLISASARVWKAILLGFWPFKIGPQGVWAPGKVKVGLNTCLEATEVFKGIPRLLYGSIPVGKYWRKDPQMQMMIFLQSVAFILGAIKSQREL